MYLGRDRFSYGCQMICILILSTKKWLFRVKSFYQVLARDPNTSFPSRTIWGTPAPTNVSFFVWCVARDKIFTRDNLTGRRMVIVNQCYTCLSHSELKERICLFIAQMGQIAGELWDVVRDWWGMSWVFPTTVVES